MVVYRERVGEIGHPTAPGLLWAGVGGLAAAFVTGIFIHSMGMMNDIPAGLVNSESVWAGWGVHLIAGVLTGLLYGAFVTTSSVGRGILYGAVFGMVIGVVAVLIIANLIVNGTIPLDTTGLMQVLLHAMWGAIVGGVQGFGVRRESGVHGRRAMGRGAY